MGIRVVAAVLLGCAAVPAGREVPLEREVPAEREVPPAPPWLAPVIMGASLLAALVLLGYLGGAGQPMMYS